MTLEERFIELLSLNPKSTFTMHFPSKESGLVKLEYRYKWDDGLGNLSQMRVLSPTLGISAAPSSWEHMLKSLDASGVDTTTFEKALERKLERQIISSYRELKNIKEVFGKSYVDDIIEEKGSLSIGEELQALYDTVAKGNDKPKFTIIKGELE
jgi:hypothetical protein